MVVFNCINYLFNTNISRIIYNSVMTDRHCAIFIIRTDVCAHKCASERCGCACNHRTYLLLGRSITTCNTHTYEITYMLLPYRVLGDINTNTRACMYVCTCVYVCAYVCMYVCIRIVNIHRTI